MKDNEYFTCVSSKEPYVYGEIGEHLIFVPFRRALERAHSFAALNWSNNWGDLLERLPVYRTRNVLNDWKERNSTTKAPTLGSRIGEGDRGGIHDDWWCEEPFNMLDWLPRKLVALLLAPTSGSDGNAPGTLSFEIGGCEMLMLPSDRATDIVGCFEKFGITVFRNDALVGWAYSDYEPPIAHS